MNQITLSGNLTREPEVRTIPNSEYSVIAFGIANNDESKKQQDGSYENVASFFECEYFTKKPQHWLAQLRKGIGVVVEGSLKQERWEKDGQKQSRIKIKLSNWPLILAGKDEQRQVAPAQQEQSTPVPPEQFEDDQIPF